MSIRDRNIRTVLSIFDAVEQRDEQLMQQLCWPDVEFCWPRSLPYGGHFRGATHAGPSWAEFWIPLQPSEQERRMDPRVVAANDTEVVVLWNQRGLSPSGERFDGEVLGLYRLKEGKLERAQMFYFDTAVVAAFLARAKHPPRAGQIASSE